MGVCTVQCLKIWWCICTGNCQCKCTFFSIIFATFTYYLHFCPGVQQQVDEFSNVYCSVPDSIQKENAWETQTYVHFCDGQGVALTLKPEHRVEDVLSLACKVFICYMLQKEHNVFEDTPVSVSTFWVVAVFLSVAAFMCCSQSSKAVENFSRSIDQDREHWVLNEWWQFAR